MIKADVKKIVTKKQRELMKTQKELVSGEVTNSSKVRLCEARKTLAYIDFIQDLINAIPEDYELDENSIAYKGLEKLCFTRNYVRKQD